MYLIWQNFGSNPSNRCVLSAGATPRPRRGRLVLPRRVRSGKSLRAFFKRRGFTTQVRKDFAGEMERTGNQNWI